MSSRRGQGLACVWQGCGPEPGPSPGSYPRRRAQQHSTKLHPVCAHPPCAHRQSFLLAPPGHLTVTVPTTGLGTREGPGSGPTIGPPLGCHSTHISGPFSGLRDAALRHHANKVALQKHTPTEPPGLTPTGRNW